jgi:hypothetical protein
MNLFETNESSFDENKNYYEELVGEGKKFKDNEALAKGKAYADQTLELMKTRMDELRNDYLALKEEAQAKASLQELIDQMEQQKKTPLTNTLVNEEVKTPAFDPKKIEDLVSEKIQLAERNKSETQNLNSVMGKLKEKYGDNYANYLKQQSEQLGLDEATVNELARKSPNAFIRTFGLDEVKQENFQAPPRNARRTDSFAPQGSEKRTWSYYQNLKKTNPMLYHDPKITNQMAKDLETLGEAFKDGDFYAV